MLRHHAQRATSFGLLILAIAAPAVALRARGPQSGFGQAEAPQEAQVPGNAAAPDTGLDTEEARAIAGNIDRTVAGLVKGGEVRGAVTLIEQGGEILYFKAEGEAAPAVPMKTDAVFRIYSMTKPIVAVAAMKLVEDGKLALTDTVAKHLPELSELRVFPGLAPDRAVTVEDLLRHTSGMIYGWGEGPVDRMYQRANVFAARGSDAFLDRVAKLPLAHQPGASWSYGISTDVLGVLCERVSKQPLDELLSKVVFEPLGMGDTGFRVTESQRKRLTANYAPDGSVVDAPETSRYLRAPGFLSGGGGLVSTTEDYLEFLRMLRRGGAPILKPETVGLMTRNRLDKALMPMRIAGYPIPGRGFGLGLSVQIESERDSEIGSYLWGGAASTDFVVAPKADLIVITMAQRMPSTMQLFWAVRPQAFDLAEAVGPASAGPAPKGKSAGR